MLSERTQRPGELADVVPIALDGDVRERVHALAQRAQLPLALYAVCAVEAERAIAEVSHMTGLAADAIALWLDDAAAQAPSAEFEPPATRPFRAYGRALMSAGYNSRPRGDLELVVPDRQRARWSVAAQGEGLTLERWVISQLIAARPGVARWEAQAAAEAQTLSEWIALQALLRCRRSSTSAHANAAG